MIEMMFFNLRLIYVYNFMFLGNGIDFFVEIELIMFLGKFN